MYSQTPSPQQRRSSPSSHGLVVTDVVAELYRDIPADDLGTAGRVLALLTARAEQKLDRR